MANIPNTRRGNTVVAHIKLKDGGLLIPWSDFSGIRVDAYSVEQRMLAAQCEAVVNEDDDTILDVTYSGDSMQYLGLCKVIVRGIYDSRKKTYDAPLVNFVADTAQATGVIVVTDPEVNVLIDVQEVSTSVLDEAIAAAIAAAEHAEETASKSPYIDDTTGNWMVYNPTTGEYVDSGVPATGPEGPQGVSPMEFGTGEHSAYLDGSDSVASGQNAVAIGTGTTASGKGSTSEGNATVASGDNSHAEGDHTNATGGKSHAEGRYTEALNTGEHAEGHYNVSIPNKTRHTVGIGTANNARKNAHTITNDGKHYIPGIGGYEGTESTAENLSAKQDLASVIATFVTRSVNDLANYYRKSETYTKTEVDAIVAALYQFHFEVYASLEAITSPSSNVLYLIGPTGSGADKYEEYVYSNSTFVKIGDTSIDLSGYVTTTALNTALATKVNVADIVDNLSTNDATKPLSAKQGKVLGEQVSQLGQEVDGIDVTESDSNSSTAWFNYELITGILLKQGKAFRVMLTSTVAFSRIIILYNNDNSKRLIDTTDNIDGVWLDFVAPVNITELGFYYIGGANATVSLSCKTTGVEELATGVDKKLNEIVKGALTGFNYGSCDAASSAFTITDVVNGLTIPYGAKFNVRVVSAKPGTYYIINYNNDSAKRLISTAEDISGKWLSFTAPENITTLGIYYVGQVNNHIDMYCQNGTYFFPDKSVDSTKIADKAVQYSALADSVLNKILPADRTNNLYDGKIIDGKYINSYGAIADATGWAISSLIPVTAGEKYTISCNIMGRSIGLNWYYANGNLLSTQDAIYTTNTAPANASFMQFNVASNGVYSTDVMVVHGESPAPYVPYIQTEAKYVSGLNEVIKDVINGGELSISIDGNTISVTNGIGTITAKLENNSGDSYGGNPVFNFTGFSYDGLTYANTDDIAPMHILNTTLGANHGQPCQIATISSHGLDNTAIGTGWEQDGHIFYVMRIIDANNVVFLSENLGTLGSPSFATLIAGVITKGADTLTISSLSGAQLYPALKNHTISLMLNGDEEISENGTYSSTSFDVVEEYDIMNPVSTLQKIIARAGTSDAPEYDGDAAVHVKNIYRFDKTLAIVVITTVIPLEEIAFSNYMFAHTILIASGAKYYIPNSLPLASGYDFRTPLAVTWSSSVPALNVGASQMADTDNPVNRVVQYDEVKKVGLAIGFIKGLGVGKDLLDYTGESFEIRNNTGKIYPHGVSSTKIGSTIEPGMIYQAVMYRSPFSFDALSGRMSMYHFELDGAEYVFADYASSLVDTILIDSSLNGRSIEVVEAVNTVLVTDIYNGGFMVNATYVQNETCYIIVKIK